ncbi:MAG TPA: transcriptional repressor [Desulfobacterales bacterium]|nr:transcriptional repressor [Desulfobacterales bacterium]
MLSDTPMRMTRQRKVILERLRSVTSHPTADEMYEMVRQDLPKISLGTVYRNLELMSEEGVVLKIDVGGSKKRFDGNTSTHYHLRCLNCGRVDDLHMEPVKGVEAEAAALSGYQVMTHSLEVRGLCPACGEKNTRSN